jgi:hypothetical protein
MHRRSGLWLSWTSAASALRPAQWPEPPLVVRAAGLVNGSFLGQIPPVVLGGGLSLFGSGHPPERLRLVDSEVWENGVVQVRYDVIET